MMPLSRTGRELLDAAYQGDYVKLKELLRTSQAHFLSKDEQSGDTALHHAATNGHIKIVGFLLKVARTYKRDTRLIQLTNNQGNTSLNCAVLNGNIEVVGGLLKKGSDSASIRNKKYLPRYPVK